MRWVRVWATCPELRNQYSGPGIGLIGLIDTFVLQYHVTRRTSLLTASRYSLPTSAPTYYALSVLALLFASLRRDRCPSLAHRMPIAVPALPNPQLQKHCTRVQRHFL